jgi:polysaccharide biosynthesis transport protein
MPGSPSAPSYNGNSNGHGDPKTAPMAVATPLPLVDDNDFDLGQLAVVLKRRLGVFLGVSVLAMGGLTLWHLTRPPEYRGTAALLVEPVTAVNPLGDLVPSATGQGRSGLDYASQIRVLRGPTVLDPVVARVQQRYPEITYGHLLGRLTIARDGDAKVLRVTYSDVDPDRAAFVLRELVAEFTDYSVQDRQGELRRALAFVDMQIQERRREVAIIEGNLSEFQKRYDLVDVAATSGSVTQRLNQMLSDQENLRVEIASLEPLYDNLRRQVGFDPNTAIRVANLNESPTYQRLLGDLRQLEQTMAAETARFQADTPIIEALEDQRQQLLPLLQAEAQRLVGTTVDADNLGYQGSVSLSLMQQLVDTDNQLQVRRTQDQAISRAVGQLQADIQQLADLSRSFQQISRELTVAESSLNQLLGSRQELRLQMARQSSPWELISPLNMASILPVNNLPRKLLQSAVLSLLLGAGVALLRDRADQAFHSADDLVKATQLPNLATVPQTVALQQQPLLMTSDLNTSVADVLAQSQSPETLHTSFSFSEAFYSLDANLRLLSSDTPLQVVVLTSSVPGEGKSTASAHLAIAAANMGRKVLLIDGDLRKPSQHLFFNLPNRLGLSDLITQAQADPSAFALPIAGNPNLHLLVAGTRPPAPGRLLSSRRMQQLIEEYRLRYDLIILDTPPLSGMIDAKLTAAHADGLLLVVRLNRSERADVRRVLTDLENTAQAPLLGLVINGASKRRRRGYDSSYGYYGYYGYGYGHPSPPSVTVGARKDA